MEMSKPWNDLTCSKGAGPLSAFNKMHTPEEAMWVPSSWLFPPMCGWIDFPKWGHLRHSAPMTQSRSHNVRMYGWLCPTLPFDKWRLRGLEMCRRLRAHGASGPGLGQGLSTSRMTSSAGLVWAQVCTFGAWGKHSDGDTPLFIAQEGCALQWAVCIMCSRLCLNDVFPQPKTDKFKWLVPYFCTFRNSWLIDWIFNFSQKCLMLGRLCLLSPLRKEKIYIKVSFPINILYFTEWLWIEIPWLTSRSFFPHTLTKGSFSKVMATDSHLGNQPLNPSQNSVVIKHFYHILELVLKLICDMLLP